MEQKDIFQKMKHTYKHHCILEGEHSQFINDLQNSIHKYLIADPSCRLTHYTLKSKAAVNAEILRHINHFPKTVHPFSRLRKYWEYLMIITFITFFICMPYHISFVFGKNEELQSFTAIVELVTDMIFLGDIVMNFFTGVHDKQSDKIYLSLEYIGKHYLKSYFVIDFVTSFPNNFLLLIPQQNELRTIHDCIFDGGEYNDGCLFDVLDIVKFLKIVRFATLLSYIDNFFKRNSFRSFHFKITRLSLTIVLAFHFLACSEFLIERILQGHDLHSESRKDYWGEKLDVWNTTSTFEIYLHTFYRSFYLLSNFGYNLSTHSTITDEILSTIFVILGYIISIYLISHAYMLMQIIYSPSMKFQQNRYQLQEFMRYKQVPHEIQKRLLNHYDYRLQKQSYNESEIQKIVGAKLFEEISYGSNVQILKKVNFIRIMPSELTKKLSVTLTSETYLKNDIILKPGQENISMHIITNGTVAVYNATGHELRHYEDDNFFGELYLFESTPIIINYYVALETTETYSLTKDNFLRIMLHDTDPIFFERAKLIASNAIDLDQIFEDLIERVIPIVNRSTTSTTTTSKSVSGHVSLYQYNP